MIWRGAKIREAIIPDISVKLMNLCLSEDENEFFLPRTQRKGSNLEFRADWALQTCIKERIERNNTQTIPLVLRKKYLLEKLGKTKDEEPKENNKIEDLFEIENAPIMMRKHLLYKLSRAG